MTDQKKNAAFIEKCENWLMEKVMPVATAMSNQAHLSAIRNAMTCLIPLTIVGGFSILLAQPPISEGSTNVFLLAWQSMADKLGDILWIPYYLTMGVLSLYVALCVAYFLAEKYELNPLTNGISSLALFTIISRAYTDGVLDYSRFGSGYMFGAILVSIISVEITRFFMNRNIKIKMPDSVPPNVTAPFEVLLPFAASVVIMSAVNVILINTTGGGFTDLIFTIFQPLMKATGSIPSVLLINFIMIGFWFFGIHGDNMVSPVTSPITTAAIVANAEAYAAGRTAPYVYAGFAATVFGDWIFFFCLQFVMLFVCKSARLKSLVKVSIIPSAFNINEPGVFGIPTVLNVFILIPDLICSVINYVTYALLAEAGLVGKFVINAPWTMPGPINAFLSTGFDFRTVILWFVLFAVNFVIATPFVKAYDNQLLAEESEK